MKNFYFYFILSTCPLEIIHYLLTDPLLEYQSSFRKFLQSHRRVKYSKFIKKCLFLNERKQVFLWPIYSVYEDHFKSRTISRTIFHSFFADLIYQFSILNVQEGFGNLWTMCFCMKWREIILSNTSSHNIPKVNCKIKSKKYICFRLYVNILF